MPPRLPLPVALLLLSACSGNHDQLALRPSPSNDASAPTHDLDAGDEDAALDDADAAKPGDPDAATDPPGPFVLTVVNGMPDAPAIRLCFVPVVEGEERVAEAVLWPAEGLGYGRAKVVAALGVDWATKALRPYVLSGEGLAEVESCADALTTDDDDLVTTALPVLPAAGVTEGRSVLLVTTGCARADEGDASKCHDAPFTEGGAGAVVVPLGRKAIGEGVGLQAVHAFAHGAAISMEIAPSLGLDSFTIAHTVTPGAIAPHPPSFAYDVAKLGPAPTDASIVVRDASSSNELARHSFGAALAHGGIEATTFAKGRSYALVAVGPSPIAEVPAEWRPFTMVVVEGEPIAQ